MNKEKWSDWKPFPDPRKNEFIQAPFGPGVYELRQKCKNMFILRGQGKNCAYRMASLLPAPYGQGTRRNKQKQEYVFKNIEEIEYRCCACSTNGKAKILERKRKHEEPCKFNA